MTPRQIQGFALVARRRLDRANGDRLGFAVLAARGSEDDIKAWLRRLSRD